MAEFLTRSGRQITLVDTAPTLHADGWARVQNFRLTAWLGQMGVTMLTEVVYEEITEKGLTITTKEGVKKTIEADSIIPVSPLTPDNTFAEGLRGKFAQVYQVGDCVKPGLIINAIADGYHIARTL